MEALCVFEPRTGIEDKSTLQLLSERHEKTKNTFVFSFSLKSC